MGDSPTTDWTKTIVWQTGASTAHIAECQKMALQQQQELLQDSQQRMAAWTKRRQLALETGLDALSRMSACKTPVEMMAICSEWMSGSFSRVLADFEEAQAHTARMAEHLQKASKALFDAEQAPAAAPPVNERQLPVVTGERPASLREAAD
jgi:hypothetical protein